MEPPRSRPPPTRSTGSRPTRRQAMRRVRESPPPALPGTSYRRPARRSDRADQSARKPVKGVLAAAEVTGRKPSRRLRGRGLADHGHAVRHVESEFRHAGGVVTGNDVGVAPWPVHLGRAHPKGRAVDQHSTPPPPLDTPGELRQPDLKPRPSHIGRGVKPANFDYVD